MCIRDRVYSAHDALKLAEQHPEREVVFLAIGFETTTPPTALVLRDAQARAVRNFSVLCCHVLTPSAITHILESAEVRTLGTVPIDGFIGPAHVSIVIGSEPVSYTHLDVYKRQQLTMRADKEIRIKDASGICRVMFVAKFEEAVYVLHCFQKKSQTTSQRDKEIPQTRYRAVTNTRKAQK